MKISFQNNVEENNNTLYIYNKKVDAKEVVAILDSLCRYHQNFSHYYYSIQCSSLLYSPSHRCI